MLWVSSPWANEEAGMLWSYNVTDALSRRHSRQTYFQDFGPQHLFYQNNETAKVFAYGTEPKVTQPPKTPNPSLAGF